MKKIVFFITLLIFISVNAQVTAKTTSLTPTQIKKQCYSLKNKTIRIRFIDADFIEQIAEDFYSATIYDKSGEGLYITFPKVALKWFEHIKNKNPKKRSLYATVQIGTMKNKYGATSNGPFLIMVGRNKTKKMGGKSSYSW